MRLGGFYHSCACDSYDGVILCILEHKITCLTECCNRGPEQVQRMIDSGVLILWTEPNGLEMVGKFEVGRS